MASLRLFYALWPDDAVRDVLRRLQTKTPGRVTRPENLHITLAFLGQQPEALLPQLKTILAGLPACDIVLNLDRIGYFRKNRIAWAGAHVAPDALYALHAALKQALTGQGIAFDTENRFKPHVTLARDAEPPSDEPFDAVVWHATHAALVQSTQAAGKPSYRLLATRRLDRAAESEGSFALPITPP